MADQIVNNKEEMDGKMGKDDTPAGVVQTNAACILFHFFFLLFFIKMEMLQSAKKGELPKRRR